MSAESTPTLRIVAPSSNLNPSGTDTSAFSAVAFLDAIDANGYCVVAAECPVVVQRVEECLAVTRAFYDDSVTPTTIRQLVQDFNGTVGLTVKTKTHQMLVKEEGCSDDSVVQHVEWRRTVNSFAIRLPQAGVPFPWPIAPASFQVVVEAYIAAMQAMTTTIAQSVWGVVEHCSAPVVSDGEGYAASVAFLRCVSPPEVTSKTIVSMETAMQMARGAATGATTRVAAHTDSGIFTVIPFQESLEGLQMHRRGTWQDIPRYDTSAVGRVLFLIMPGEEATAMGPTTEGRTLRATVHRVGPAVIITTTTHPTPRVTMPFQLRGLAHRRLGSGGATAAPKTTGGNVVCKLLTF